jgi:L-iditol 2-dehydrogenase
MKAGVLESLGTLRVREVERPACPRRGALLRVSGCAICGSDLRTFRHGHRAVQLPHILGHEICGTIVELDERAGFQEGARVTLTPAVSCGTCRHCRAGRFNRCDDLVALGEDIPGGFAEYVAVPARLIDAGYLAPVPPSVRSEHAAVAEPLGCVLNGQELLDVSLGDTVVVIGLGAIGCMHIAVARARGARQIMAVDISAKRLEIARGFEADVYINADERDAVAVVDQATEGRGVDVVVVACPSGNAQKQALAMAAKGGRVSYFGGLPHKDSHVSLDTNLIHYRELQVVGAFGSLPVHIAQAVDLISTGAIPMDRVVTHVFPLDDIGRAFSVATGEDSLRVVVSP